MANTEKAKPNTIAKETKALNPKPVKEAEKPAPKTEKKTRAPRARKAEELIEEATKKMTDKEKDILINYLRADNMKLGQQITALTETLDSAFQKARLIEQQYNDMEAYYKKNLGYINVQLEAFYEAIKKSTVGGTIK